MTRDQIKAEIDALTDERNQCIATRSAADKRGREIEKDIKRLTNRLLDTFMTTGDQIPQPPAKPATEVGVPLQPSDPTPAAPTMFEGQTASPKRTRAR